jgi:hypothetical protein
MFNEEPVVEDTNEPIEGEETTPTAPGEDKEPVVSEPEKTYKDWEEEFSEKGGESIVGERNRLREKIAKLEKERLAPPEPKKVEDVAKPATQDTQFDLGKFDRIEMVSGNEYGRKAVARVMESGMDKDMLSAFIDIINIVSAGNSQHFVKQGVEPIASEFREGKYAKALEAFSKEDKYKFGMSKPEIRKEVDSYIRNNERPEDWNKPEKIKAAYGVVLADHPEIFSSQSKREIIEDGDIHGRPESGAITNNHVDMANFAKREGMSFESREDKEIVRSAYAAYKATLKQKEK